MEFVRVLQQRRSVRRFKPTEIPANVIEEILKIAQLAPSAGNLQAYKVKIIKSVDIKKILQESTFTRMLTKQESIVSAPVLLIICADTEASEKVFGERGRDLYAIQDASIFAAYLQLAIVSKELASVWVGSFNEGEARTALSLPENLRPLIIIPLGYPDDEVKPRARKRLNEIIV